MVESLAQHPGTAGVALHVTGLLGDLGQSVAGGAVEAAVLGEGGYTGGVDVSALAVVATIEGGDASFEGHFDPLGGFHGGVLGVTAAALGRLLFGGKEDGVDDVDHAVVALDVGRDDGRAVYLEGAVLNPEGERTSAQGLGGSRAQGIAGGYLAGNDVEGQDGLQLLAVLGLEQRLRCP